MKTIFSLIPDINIVQRNVVEALDDNVKLSVIAEASVLGSSVPSSSDEGHGVTP